VNNNPGEEVVMNLRLAVFDVAAARQLAPAARRRFLQLAGFGVEPAGLTVRLAQGVAVLAAALGGLGLVMWIAANWESLGRLGRFALLQGVVVAMGLGAWWRPAARPALGLLALLGIGALFAYFGQTYQSGADPWQFFAVWAALGLPLALGVRSDVVWAPWVLVAMTGVSLWTHANAGDVRWWRQGDIDTTPVYLAAWGMSILLVLALGPVWRRKTGAGPWALRTSVTLAVAAITFSALIGLFASRVEPLYGLGVLVVGAAALLLSWRGHFDIFALSAVALALDTLLVCGLARWLFQAFRHDEIALLLVTGLAAAGLLAVSVQWVMRVARAHSAAGGAA
jgi:uncharacterized membrane protein